jgi:spore cortex biosynthesis protein YabQ
MLAMIAMGSFFGASLDTYNRFLKRGKRKRWIIFLNDILFWMLQGLVIFYILFLVNQGEVRFYIFIALVCGFSFYQALLKGIYAKLLEAIIQVVATVWIFFIRFLNGLIISPLKWIVILVVSIFIGIGKVLLGLVQIGLKVLLWIVKVIITPIKWIGKGLWRLFPKKVKFAVERFWTSFAGKLKHSKNKLINGMKWLYTRFKRKP